MDDLTVGILAGGKSTRMKKEKALVQFQGEPLLTHMVAKARQLTPRVLVVTSDDEQKKKLDPFASGATVVVDPDNAVRCALTGAVTAFEYSETTYTMILPVDTPLVETNLLRSIYYLREGHGAVVPTWPTGYIEPLHAIYLSEHAYSHGLRVIEKDTLRMKHLLDVLTNVLGISTEILREFDPDLNSFKNINSEQDLRNLEKSYKRH